LTPDEVHALLDAAKGDRFEAILTVAIAVGLRRGEALGLKWSDVDLDAAAVRVRRALVYVDGDLRFVDPQSKRSRRTIPLPSVSIHALREHRRRQAAERLAAGPDVGANSESPSTDRAGDSVPSKCWPGIVRSQQLLELLER